MTDLALDIAEERLEEFVLFLNHELIVEDSLHGVAITQVGEDGQSLQLCMILLIVENRLWDDNISLDHLRDVSHRGPRLLRLHLEALQHQLVAN